MKTSLAISALILAAAAGLGWETDARLAAAGAEERKLAAEASGFGLSIADGHAIRATKRERTDRDRMRQLVIDFNAIASIWESGGLLDSALQERNREIRERLRKLETSQLKAFIAHVLASKDLTERIRAARAVVLLGILAENDPRGALALFTEHHALLETVPHAESVISDCLGNWAKEDPAAAVDWMKKNPGNFPDEMIRSAQRGVIHSAAGKDPRLAFRLASDFDTEPMDPFAALHTIVTAAGDNEARSMTLAALREHLDGHKDDPAVSQHADRAFGYFSWGFKPDGLEAAKQWVASADLSPKELDGFCAGLSISSAVDEPARWIEWMGAAFPPGKGDGHIVNLMSRWTRDDYESAGEWLGRAPDGPSKNAAIRGYAQTIFNHDPDTAMQWIMTLPPGKDRNETLKNLYLNWPKDEPATKEAFAKEHGIE